jgi:hypothetical protein
MRKMGRDLLMLTFCELDVSTEMAILPSRSPSITPWAKKWPESALEYKNDASGESENPSEPIVFHPCHSHERQQ